MQIRHVGSRRVLGFIQIVNLQRIYIITNLGMEPTLKLKYALSSIGVHEQNFSAL